jgi:hypothetical protein
VFAIAPKRAIDHLRRPHHVTAPIELVRDLRRHLGIRSFSASLPSDLGLRTSFGRDIGHGPDDRRKRPTSGADTPLG